MSMFSHHVDVLVLINRFNSVDIGDKYEQDE